MQSGSTRDPGIIEHYTADGIVCSVDIRVDIFVYIYVCMRVGV